MAILKFNQPPSGTQEDRRAHVVGHGDNVSLQHAAFGDKVQGGAQVNTLNENVQLATRWSTAPYRGDLGAGTAPTSPPNPWGYRAPERVGRCMANDDTCNGYASKASGRKWCAGHARNAEKAE